MTSREERLAWNETLFREVNERLETRTGPHDDDDQLTILCECADATCTARIEITAEEYRAVRADEHQFALVPGHERLELEEVVSRNERYEIVRKVGIAGDIAEATDETS